MVSMDRVTKETRRKIMRRIKSKWTRPETLVHNYLKGRKIRHKMHPNVRGNPDILLKDTNVAIFIDGCFWHGCPIHFRMPKSNAKFWRKKIENNVMRDVRNTEALMDMGYKVVRIWEHQLSSASLRGVVVRLLDIS